MPELSLGMALDFAGSALCFFAALKTIKPVNQSISRLYEYPRGEYYNDDAFVRIALLLRQSGGSMCETMTECFILLTVLVLQAVRRRMDGSAISPRFHLPSLLCTS